MFISTGIIKYYRNPDKVIVEVDNELSKFYKSLIPKYLNVKNQMFLPHISVVRRELYINFEYWNKYNGKEVEFLYDNYIYNGEVYYWLNVFSEELERIKIELVSNSPQILNLPKNPEYYQDGRYKFHITLGNIKEGRIP